MPAIVRLLLYGIGHVELTKGLGFNIFNLHGVIEVILRGNPGSFWVAFDRVSEVKEVETYTAIEPKKIR